jgi:hypothetical protein
MSERNTYNLPQGEPIRRELVRLFRELRKASMDAIRQAVPGVKAAPDHGALGGGMAPSIPSITWDHFWPGTLETAYRFVPLLEAIWDPAGRNLMARVGQDPELWSVEDPNLQKAITDSALALCEETLATTSRLLDDALHDTREALREGAPIRELTKRVNAVFDGAETWRARRIATSESSRAYHAAELESARSSGVVVGFEWLLSADACPLCQTVARRVPRVRLGERFAEIGDNATYKDIRHPPLHPGCQCSLLEIMSPAYGGPADVDFSPPLIQPKPEEQDTAATEGYEPIPHGQSPFGRWEG